MEAATERLRLQSSDIVVGDGKAEQPREERRRLGDADPGESRFQLRSGGVGRSIASE